MQLRDIQYVLAAADEGSFSKAAVKVHVSQPALSQLIQRLEDELGVKLFVRKSNRVTLTPAGKIFYEDGKVILTLSEQLIHKMNDFQSLKKGELTISVSPFYQKCYLLGVLSEFQKRHFGIKVRLVDAFSSDSETLLVQGQVDLAFVMLPYQNKSIKYERVFEEQIFLAVPRQFAINRKLPDPGERPCTIEDLKALKDEPFVMYEHGRRMWGSSMALCRSAGFEPRVAFESNVCESLNAMVAGGMGVGFVPSAIDRINGRYDSVIYYPIDDENAVRTLTIGYMEKNVTSAAREFVRVVKGK